MKKTISSCRWLRMLLPAMLLAVVIYPSQAAEPGAPQIMITEPKEGAALTAGNVTVSVQVQNFSLVNKLGKPNVAGEGHIHYFIDVAAPTTPGKLAVTASGTFAPTPNTTFTWKNASAGMHNFSVELANNDHTPLSPPVVAEVNVTVKDSKDAPATNNVVVGISAMNIAFNTSTITVPAGANVTMKFDNQDANVGHNVAVYETSAADKPIYVGDIITGPKMVVYNFTAPDKAGTYFFRCDVHPSMNGKFVVT